MKTKLSALLLGLTMSSCFFDDAAKAIDEAKSSLNQQLADAKRNADGLIQDPALRDSALSQLRRMIPDSLVIASNLAQSGETYGDKIAKLQGVLNLGAQVGTDLSAMNQCLAALPKTKVLQNNPECYGPTLAFDRSIHPDALGGSAIPNEQLPPLDLGIWTEKQGEQACAAAKMNQLTANTSYYADLAAGSMAAMACVAGFYGDTIPGDGKKLDLSSKFSKLSLNGNSIDSAFISRNGSIYQITFTGKLNGDSVRVRTNHNSLNNSGVVAVQSKTTQLNQGQGPQQYPYRTTTVKYIQGSTAQYRLASAQYGDQNSMGPTNTNLPTGLNLWQKSIHPETLELDITPSAWSSDLNVVLASYSAQESRVAYGWQAGSGDGFLRVFNAHTKGTEGTAWFGFHPSCVVGQAMGGASVPTCPTTLSIVALDTLLKADRMICNWAGPNNDHSGQKLVQRQKMSLVGSVWSPTESNIKYAPTNQCVVTNPLTFPTLGTVLPHQLLELNSTNYGFQIPTLP